MTELTSEQTKYLIEKSQSTYLSVMKNATIAFRLNPDYHTYRKSSPFKESCRVLSWFIHYLAKNELNVPDKDNEIYQCEFIHAPGTFSHGAHHFLNRIYGKYVDSSIVQFNAKRYTFSPYADNTKHYAKVEKIEFNSYESIREMIDYYKASNMG